MEMEKSPDEELKPPKQMALPNMIRQIKKEKHDSPKIKPPLKKRKAVLYSDSDLNSDDSEVSNTLSINPFYSPKREKKVSDVFKNSDDSFTLT